ncbi:hypothetical protein TNCT_77621 [Trichonephila clavata]|uniref:Uncharacterized protein n=1 Tax=Trichonephila clavata TaxID=2740835 RepID=A0A8X6KF97_TRICU|nr:hypothetical protein TNCT_77621 [Trichonephila clavata]
MQWGTRMEGKRKERSKSRLPEESKKEQKLKCVCGVGEKCRPYLLRPYWRNRAGISEIPVAASSIRLRESGFQDRDRVLLEKVTRYVKNRDNDFGERQVGSRWREVLRPHIFWSVVHKTSLKCSDRKLFVLHKHKRYVRMKK